MFAIFLTEKEIIVTSFQNSFMLLRNYLTTKNLYLQKYAIKGI